MHPRNLRPIVEVEKYPNTTIQSLVHNKTKPLRRQITDNKQAGDEKTACLEVKQGATAKKVDAVSKTVDTKGKQLNKLGADVATASAKAESAKSGLKTLERTVAGLGLTEKIAQVTSKLSAFAGRLYGAEGSLEKLLSRVSLVEGDVTRNKNDISARTKQLEDVDTMFKWLASGNLILVPDTAMEEISAAALNAAAAGTFIKSFTCTVSANIGTDADPIYRTHTTVLSTVQPALTPLEFCDNAAIGVPTIKWTGHGDDTPSAEQGIFYLDMIADTDAGSTKVYLVPQALTGTLTFTTDSADVTGSGTAFTTELAVGEYIQLDADALPRKIQSITDDTNLVLVDDYDGTGGAGAGSLCDVVECKIKIDATATRPWAVAEIIKAFNVVA